jgi:predicted transcriptional regulator
MQRVYASVDEATVHRLDELAGAQKVHRSEVVGKAIESYLHPQVAPVSPQEEQQRQEIAHLKELLQVRESEIQHLRSMSNDLRSLVDVMAAKLPALPPGPEELKEKGKWWRFWE